jgi:CRP-like cAMP-binding protein
MNSPRHPQVYKNFLKISGGIGLQEYLSFESYINFISCRRGQRLSAARFQHVENHCYFSTSGWLRTYHLTLRSREYTLDFHPPFEIVLPSTSVEKSIEKPLILESVTPSEVGYFSLDVLRDFSNASTQWSRLFSEIALIQLRKKQLREFECLTMSAFERYTSLLKNNPDIIGVIPQHQIASYIGITPVAMTRLKKTGKTS